MSKQSEALRIADQLRDMSTQFKTPSHNKGVCNGAVQELRRLHEVNVELLEALKGALATIKDYLAYDHNGDPWTEDARLMGEMDVNDYERDGRLDRANIVIVKAMGEA